MLSNDIVNALRYSKNIAIIPHVAADGDALGSCLALGIALKKLKKTVKIYVEEKVPDLFSFLPGLDMIELYANGSTSYDVVAALDTGDLQRLGNRIAIFNSADVTLNIDHHKTNTAYAAYNYVNDAASSTAEIIYQLLKLMELDIDRDMALCMYVAITTDTGGFKYSNTTQLTHNITADLISCGVDVAETSRKIFETISKEKVLLTGKAINSLELLYDGQVCAMTLTEDDIRSAGAGDEDCDGIVGIARNIKGSEVGILFTQKAIGQIKVSLRSNVRVDVSDIAGKFSGGGHIRAAGCTINGNLAEIKQMVLDEVRDAIYR